MRIWNQSQGLLHKCWWCIKMHLQGTGGAGHWLGSSMSRLDLRCIQHQLQLNQSFCRRKFHTLLPVTVYLYITILTLMNICHDFLTSFQKHKHLHSLTTFWEFCREGISVVSRSKLQQQNHRLGIADLGTCTTAWLLCLNWLMDLGGNQML